MSDQSQPSLTVADKTYWDDQWRDVQFYYDPFWIWFKNLFARYTRPGMECLECGCFPGGYMIYLAKELGCSVSGVDFTERFDEMRAFFAQQGVRPVDLFNEDFMQFDNGKSYDFVYSLGFVEHFINFEEVIVRHTKFLRPGGVLMITCPNLTGAIQHLLNYIFNRKVLREHHLPSINVRAWRHILEQNGMEILQAGYYGTFVFVAVEEPRPRIVQRMLNLLFKASFWLSRRVNLPTPWLSPYIYCIARKR